jgi:hypothetical protein
MTARVYAIPGGFLHIHTVLELMPLDDLLGFAARANPRRPFLFVSKVLGRHIPCRPSLMRETYRLLAQDLANAPGPLWIIGMAETATGLAAGVADTLAREHGRADVSFHHTTRMPLNLKPLAEFCESHSHARSHLLYRPHSWLEGAFRHTRTLVIVDDEISTGRTLAELVERTLPSMPLVERVAIVTLANWLDPASRQGIEDRVRRDGSAIATSWHTLLAGTFAFEPDADFRPGTLPTNAEAAGEPQWAREDLGRRGIAVPRGGVPIPAIDLDRLELNRPVAVVGTGECAFQPFLLAESLELTGYTATVQCTSRSPVQVGGAIAATMPCPDPYGQSVAYYLHNPPPQRCLGVSVSERDCGQPPVVAAGNWLHCRVPEPLQRLGG